MYIKKLIERLEKALEENGDMPVYIYSDYGQMSEIISGSGVRYRDTDGESYDIEDLKEFEVNVNAFEKIYEIWGG